MSGERQADEGMRSISYRCHTAVVDACFLSKNGVV